MGNNERKSKNKTGNKTARESEVKKLKWGSENDVNTLKVKGSNDKTDDFFVENEAAKHTDKEKRNGKKEPFSDLHKIWRILGDNYTEFSG